MIALLDSTDPAAVKTKKHRIREFNGPFIECTCAWHYRCPHPSAYGVLALKDFLLDKYNEHRAKMLSEGENNQE